MDSEKKKEQQRVDYVIGRIKEKIETTENELEKARKETSSVEKNYVQNAKINTFEVDDRMETNAEVQQQKQLVAKNVENEAHFKTGTFKAHSFERFPLLRSHRHP